jgi:hypothetical protein
MPLAIFNHVIGHNIELSLTIKMDDRDQYFKEIINFMFKNLHNATC